MSIQLIDLPTELLFKILQNLSGVDLSNVCQTCKTLQEVGRVDKLWQKRCHDEYRFPYSSTYKFSFYNIYSRVLHRYGRTVGLWKRQHTVYGGLVWIRYDEGKIIGSELLAPRSPQVRDCLRYHDLFTISLNEEAEIVLTCSSEGPDHSCRVQIENTETGNQCTFSCEDHDCHHYFGSKIEPENEDELVQTVQHWINDERGEDFNADFIHIYFLRGFSFVKNIHRYSMEPLIVQGFRKNVPIQPGLFKGTYSAHGIEILLMEYSEDNTELSLLKITGDPNIPATKISVKADLQRPMILNREQQDYIRHLQDSDTADVEPGTKLTSQPFCIPIDCYERHNFNLPSTCSFRCHAKGQIAGDGYHDPTWCACHFVVFDENSFGNLWLGLHSFSYYSRVEENLVL